MYFPPCISDGPSVILFGTHEAWSEGLEARRSKPTNIKRQKRPSPHSACSLSAVKTENSNTTNSICLRPPSPFQALRWQLSGHQDRNPLCNFNGSWFYFIIFYKPVHLISEKRKKRKCHIIVKEDYYGFPDSLNFCQLQEAQTFLMSSYIRKDGRL